MSTKGTIDPKMDTKGAIHSSWNKYLQQEFKKEYFKNLKNFLAQEIKNGHSFFPHPKKIFKAFELCPFEETNVVILGQDPYHNTNQAHGLSFSVEKGVPIPPSLKNIYKEIKSDLKIPIPSHGNLTCWAKQGILMLNTTLTVRAHEANSHSKIGWQIFTDKVIQTISQEKSGIIFLLWGNFARSKKNLIDLNKNIVLESTHPSPFSAHNGFFGCKHFSLTNKALKTQGKKEIDWSIPE